MDIQTKCMICGALCEFEVPPAGPEEHAIFMCGKCADDTERKIGKTGAISQDRNEVDPRDLLDALSDEGAKHGKV